VSLEQARVAASIFDPQRLRIARQLRKLSRAGLAELVEVSPAAVGQWEASSARPKPQTLLQVAAVLDFPVAYFAASGRELPEFETDLSFFRSLRKSSQADREAALAHAALISELVEVIERYAKLPALDIPEHPLPLDASPDQIDSAACALRDAWGLGDEPVENMLRELELHGTVAVRLGLADEGIDAFSWPAPAHPVVILDSGKGDKARSRFDCAHELGHLVMHRKADMRAADRALEKHAHRFASSFLLPAARLHQEWPTGRLDWRKLVALKQRWQMSLGALLYRAQDVGLVTATTYESAMKYMSKSGWRKREPGELGPPERPRLLRRAAEALEKAGIDTEQLAELAHIPIEEVRMYLTMPAAPGRVTVEL
jgi:Zn-dependent peptidase ImmA (M78 family)/transcriptional regulator with XRE-family HTH domain